MALTFSKAKTTDFIKPGDVLLYKAKGLFGWLITRKTWHNIGHVEVYVGDGQSVASRDHQGTGKYPLRLSELMYVCRPKRHFDCAKALAWFEAQPHQPYGWFDLLSFTGWNVDGKGIVCSPFATTFIRAGGLDPFNGEPAIKIAPFQFALSSKYAVFQVDQDGNVIHPVTP